MALTLTSPAFDDHAAIPDKHGYTAANTSPPLQIDGVPDAAESLVLIMDDPDAMAPAGKIWDHWLVWNIPPHTAFLENGLPEGAVEGENDYGEQGYGGPNPPDGQHTYRFMLYALDTALDLPAGASRDALEAAIKGHVLEQTTLHGTYAP